MSPFFKTFDFMTKFSCIGPNCEDTCCSGWKVNLYRKDYDKIKAVLETDKSKTQYKGCLKRNPPGQQLEENFGYLDFSNGGHCGMMDNGWCVLHRDHGEKLLPIVCATYPRLILEYAGGQEVQGLLSCPEVARLCLLSEQLPELMDTGREQLPEIFETNPQPREKGNHYVHYLPETMNVVRRLISETEASVSAKNYLVVYLAKKLEPFYYSGVATDPGSRLQRTLARMFDSVFQQQTLAGFGQSNLEDPKIRGLILAIVNARLGGAHFIRYNQLRDTVLKSYGTGDTSLAREGVIGNDVPLASLWKAFLRRRELVLSQYNARVERYFLNFSVAFWWQKLLTGDRSMLATAHKLVLYQPLLRFFFLSHPRVIAAASEHLPDELAGPILDQVIVEVVQIFMKNIDANRTMQQSFLQPMASMGIESLSDFAGLLQI